jgi:hypothetical protein
MTQPFTFSYIVVEQQVKDVQGNPVVSVYPFWITAIEDKPIQILRSSVPNIMVKLYPGNRYPTFDYREAIEERVKKDIERNVDYDAAIASQINDRKWHLI